MDEAHGRIPWMESIEFAGAKSMDPRDERDELSLTVRGTVAF
jgi:hypothetical protein